MADPTFPTDTWQRDDSATESLAPVKAWLDETAQGQRYRVVVVCGGKLLAEWCQGVGAEEQLGLASAAKSVFSCMLAIAVEEGKIESPDAKVVEVYPEMMDVSDGTGPKPGRYAFPEDVDITFRQLICNTSGYMKPGEEPGQGVGYLEDGTMIVAENSREKINEEITLSVTSVLQTSAGRMIFGRPEGMPVTAPRRPRHRISANDSRI